MKRSLFLYLICGLVLFCYQSLEAATPIQVQQVSIRDGHNTPMKIPYLGEKHLLIFYIDPEVSNQNKEFREGLEEHQINSPNIYAFGVVNLKDAPLFPNGLVRMMIRQKIRQTGAQIYTDPTHLLRDGWNLGDVDDKFTLIFVNKNREIEFIRKGEMSPQDIDTFFQVIKKYK